MKHSEADLSQIKAVLFDLDGTLLQVEMKEFIPCYLRQLAAWFEPRVQSQQFQAVVRGAIHGLLLPREGHQSNEALFLQSLELQLEISPEQFRQTWRSWFAAEAESLQPLVAPHPLTRSLVETAQARGCRVVIATNPVFPRELIDARLRWAGLADYQFELVTSYENCCHCKPNSDYFHDLLACLQLSPAECLMVGNDNQHDLSAVRVGIPTYLVDTWLIDRGAAGLIPDFSGDHQDLLAFIEHLA